MEEKRAFTGPIVAALLLLLLPCLYVGAYYTMVKRSFPNFPDGRGPRYHLEWVPSYSVGGGMFGSVVYPIYQIDRLIRPSYWVNDGTESSLPILP